MVRCDIEVCTWEGNQLGLHKVKSHNGLISLKGVRFGQGNERDFRSLKNVITQLGTNLTLKQIQELNGLLIKIVEDKHNLMVKQRTEEDKLFNDIRHFVNSRNGVG